MQNGVGLGDVRARGEHRLHRASKRCGAGDIGEARSRWIELQQIERARLHGEIAGDRHCRAGGARSRRKDAAAIDERVAHHAGAAERAAVVHAREARACNRAVDNERAAIHIGGAGIAVDPGEEERAGADVDQRAGSGGAGARDCCRRSPR